MTGTPNKPLSPDAERFAGLVGGDARNARNRRKPFTVAADEIPGYNRRWKYRYVNDEGNNLEDALYRGFFFVDTNGKKISDLTKMGSRKRDAAGKDANGFPVFRYLMAISAELYEEDTAIIQGRVDSRMDVIRHGQINRKSGDGRDMNDKSDSIHID